MWQHSCQTLWRKQDGSQTQKRRPSCNWRIVLCLTFKRVTCVAGLVKAVTAILPDIVEIAGRQPDPEAQAKAEASVMVRQQKSISHPTANATDDYTGKRKERYDT